MNLALEEASSNKASRHPVASMCVWASTGPKFCNKTSQQQISLPSSANVTSTQTDRVPSKMSGIMYNAHVQGISDQSSAFAKTLLALIDKLSIHVMGPEAKSYAVSELRQPPAEHACIRTHWVLWAMTQWQKILTVLCNMWSSLNMCWPSSGGSWLFPLFWQQHWSSKQVSIDLKVPSSRV